MRDTTIEIPVDFTDGTWNDVADPQDPFAHIYGGEDNGEYIVEVRARQIKRTTYRVGNATKTVTHQIITNRK